MSKGKISKISFDTGKGMDEYLEDVTIYFGSRSGPCGSSCGGGSYGRQGRYGRNVLRRLRDRLRYYLYGL